MAATSASDCTDCSNPPPSTPAPHSVRAFQGGGVVARHFSSYFMVNASALALKSLLKWFDLRNALYLKECILRTSLHLTLHSPPKTKLEFNYKKNRRQNSVPN